MNKPKRTVTEFLRRIREEYNTSRETYSNLCDEVAFYENTKKEKLSEHKNDISEKTYISVKYDKLISEKKNQIKEFIDECHAKFDKISADCEEVFGKHNRPTGDKVDIGTIELLKSGILKTSEIKALSKDFDGNCAMLRIIGNYAFEEGERKQDAELRKLGSTLKHYEIPYKKHIDELVFWSQQGLREDRVLSDGIAKRYDENADRIFAAAEGICVDAEE